MKTWKKLVWSKSRVFVSLRVSDIIFAGLEQNADYEYRVIPEKKKFTILVRRIKEE
jgi:hypothetical protein